MELTHLASERLELSCELSQADAPVRWYRDNQEVEESPNLILEVDGAQRRLVIPLTSVDDAGEYMCDTEDDSVKFLVTVTGKNDDKMIGIWILWPFFSVLLNDFEPCFNSEPPVKLTRPENVPEQLKSVAGEPVVLEIKVSRPSSEVKWRLNGREIEESSNVTITEDGLIHRLTIYAPTPEDSGKYTCDCGDDKMDFQVNVSGKRKCQVSAEDDFCP